MDLTPGSAHSSAGPATKQTADDKHKQTIIAIASVMGILLTYLIYRRSQSASAAAASGATDTSSTPVSDPSTDADQQLGTAQLGALQNIETTLTGLPGSIGALIPVTKPVTTTPAPVTKPPTAAHTYKLALWTVYRQLYNNWQALQKKAAAAPKNKTLAAQAHAAKAKAATAQVAYTKAPN